MIFREADYSYSLRLGINDGFLAPYRVRRVLMGPKQEEEQIEEAEEFRIKMKMRVYRVMKKRVLSPTTRS